MTMHTALTYSRRCHIADVAICMHEHAPDTLSYNIPCQSTDRLGQWAETRANMSRHALP